MYKNGGMKRQLPRKSQQLLLMEKHNTQFYNLDAIISVGYRVNETDYFKELLARIRSIRAGERRIWQQITDIFAECSIDYDK